MGAFGAIRRRRSAVGWGAAAAVALTLVVTPAAIGAEEVSSSPVEFDVVVRNDSGAPCLGTPDGQHAVMRGVLVGPSEKVESGTVDGALYSHGNGYGRFFWNWTEDSEYNYALDMARRGHVSLAIDRLGYEDSDAVDGNAVCWGHEADVLHQVIGQLRAGSYRGERTPTFAHLALVGHSASGFIADQEAAGFHDVDALGIISSGEFAAGESPVVAERVTGHQARCAGRTDGFAPLEADEAEFRSDHIVNMADDIASKIVARRNDDACAGTRNAATAVAAAATRNGTIDVPVLLLAGDHDAFFPDQESQARTYSGSRDLDVVTIMDSGHALAFGRTAPVFRDEMDRWLDKNAL